MKRNHRHLKRAPKGGEAAELRLGAETRRVNLSLASHRRPQAPGRSCYLPETSLFWVKLDGQ